MLPRAAELQKRIGLSGPCVLDNLEGTEPACVFHQVAKLPVVFREVLAKGAHGYRQGIGPWRR